MKFSDKINSMTMLTSKPLPAPGDIIGRWQGVDKMVDWEPSGGRARACE